MTRDPERHLTDDELAGYVLEDLVGEDQAAVDAHLRFCVQCKGILDAYFRRRLQVQQSDRERYLEEEGVLGWLEHALPNLKGEPQHRDRVRDWPSAQHPDLGITPRLHFLRHIDKPTAVLTRGAVRTRGARAPKAHPDETAEGIRITAHRKGPRCLLVTIQGWSDQEPPLVVLLSRETSPEPIAAVTPATENEGVFEAMFEVPRGDYYVVLESAKS